MFKAYIKYLISFKGPVMTYSTFKNTIMFSESVILEAKKRAKARAHKNIKDFNKLGRKKLPVIRVSKRGNIDLDMTRGKTLEELSIESDRYAETHSSEFNKEYIEDIKMRKLYRAFQ